MTGLTAYVNLVPGSVVSLFAVVVVFPEVGRVTFCTHVIPVLCHMRPVKYIIMRNTFILVYVIPSLTSFFGRAGIPAKGQALVSPSWEWYQVLLQGSDAKYVGDRVVMQFSIRSLCIYNVFPIFHEKAGCDAKMGQACIIEIAQHRFCNGSIHGHVVVRSLVKLILLFVTLFAIFTTHIAGLKNRRIILGPGVISGIVTFTVY